MPKPRLNLEQERYEDINNPPVRPEPRKGTREGVPSRAGQPTYYCTNYDNIAFQLALLGAAEESFLAAFNICLATFYKWKKHYPSFRDAVKRGKELADARVAHAMYSRAIGYTFESEKLFYDRESGEVIRAKTIEHCPPDVSAGKYWLGTRQRGLWTETNRTEITGSDGKPLVPPVINILPVKALSQE